MLFLFSSIVFFSGAGNQGIPKDQEGRAAIISKNILESGNWLDINAPGEIVSEKPIMSYWLCAASCWLFGINEFGLRVPTILAGIFTVLLTCYLGSRIYGSETGFLAGYLIGTMQFFVYSCHLVFIDAVLCCCYLISMVFLYEGYFREYKANKLLYFFYIFLAAAVLLKGPASILLAGLTILLLAIKKRSFRIVWELKPISGFFIILLISAPWYVYECIHKGNGFAWDFFINQNVSRFTGINMAYKDGKRGSFFFYFANLLYGALPWSLLIPFALITFRKKFLRLSDKAYFPAFWIAAVFIFFSFAAIKRGDYILPLYPALAILIAHYLQTTIFDLGKFKYSRQWNIACVLILIIGLIAGALIKSGLLGYVGELAKQDRVMFISKWDGRNMVAVSNWINSSFLITVMLLFVLIGFLYYLGKLFSRGQSAKAVNVCIILTGLLLFSYFEYLVPYQYRNESVKEFCHKARLAIPENATVCYYGDWNTEAVFFVDHKYERAESLYNKDGEFKFQFIFTSPDIYRTMSQSMKSKLPVVIKTPEDHRNPLILLESIPQH